MLYGYRQLHCTCKNKWNDIYNDIAEDVETRFYTSNFELERPLPKGLIGLMEDELGGKTTIYFVGLRAKT